MRRSLVVLMTATALLSGTTSAWADTGATASAPGSGGPSPASAAPDLIGGELNAATGGITSTERTSASDTLDDVESLLHADRPRTSSQTTVDPTLLLRNLSLQYAALPRLDRHAAGAQFQRPYFDGEPGVKDDCSGNVCLHWRSSSAPMNNARASLKTDTASDDWATKTVLPVLTAISSTYGKAGYRSPKADAAHSDVFPIGTDGAQVERYQYDQQGNVVLNSDGSPKDNPEWLASGKRTVTRPEWGQSGATDVYLADLGNSGVYGYCAYDVDDTGKYLVYPTSHGDVPAFCVLDNDFSPQQYQLKYGESSTDILKVTAAHEYFHAVQFAYDAFEDSWFMEATATWAEHQVYPSIPDNRQFLPYSPLRFPTTSIDTWAGNGGFLQYGDWIFFEYLTERFPTRTGALPNLVKTMWDYADSTRRPDQYSIQAVASALATRRASLSTVFAQFAAANLRPASTYRGGAAYPATQPRRNLVLGAHKKRSGSARIDHLASYTVRLRPHAVRPARHRATISVNLANRALGTAAIATVVRRDGSTSVRMIKLSKKGNGSIRVAFSTKKVLRVDLTLVNGNHSYRSCSAYQQGYSCGGSPVHDNLKSSWSIHS